MTKQGRIAMIVCTVAIVAVAADVGSRAWDYFHPARSVETSAPAARLGDGSLEQPRAPDPDAKPKTQIPKGSTPIRIGTVTVKPKATDGSPVTIDWTAVRADEGVRVITKSDQGEVTGGVDIPIADLVPPHRPWAIGVAGSSSGAAALISRDITTNLSAMAIVTMNARDGRIEQHAYVGAQYRFDF